MVGLGGNYTVYVSNDLGVQFVWVARVSGNSSFDLASTDLEMARYVRIEYFSGMDIALDAIVAINLNTGLTDTDPPLIEEIADYCIPENMTSTTLIWEVYDLTPWNYEVYVNNSLVASEVWNESSISFELIPLSVGIWNVTLLVQDAFHNIATDIVFIDVQAEETSITTGTDIPEPLLTIVVTAGVIAAGVVFILGYYLHKKKGSPT